MPGPADAVPYLLRRGLRPSRVVDGNVVVEDASSRNPNLRVLSAGGPGYLLKQADGPEAVAALAHEARVCRLLRSIPGGRVRRFLPAPGAFDRREGLLVVELLPGARDLREHQRRIGRFPPWVAATVGRAMAALHTDTRDRLRRLPSRSPWILAIHHPDLALYREMSGASVELVKAVQGQPELCRALDELRQGWRPSALLHHDLRWENVLVCGSRAGGERRRVKIVDWELAGRGDPCWDVGCALSEYFASWLLAGALLEPPGGFAPARGFPLAAMQPALAACWRTYALGMRLDAARSARWLVRSLRYTAARLVQTAYEHAQLSSGLGPELVRLLQFAANVMSRPAEASVHVAGIRLSKDGG